MPLPTPKLDDLTFQQIVDHARKLIPVYCPEWTDHNVSDPGITLIELFASMTELLLYRVNQVPDKMYLTFLNLIGYQLSEPCAAYALVTFYLAAPASGRETIDAGTEVSTLRTETRPPIIFTTTKPLEIRPPQVIGVATCFIDGAPIAHPLADNRFKEPVTLFSQPQPLPNDAFYIGLANDHSDYVLDIEVRCLLQKGIGIKTDQGAPFIWEVVSSVESVWSACVLEYDTSSGFNFNGRMRIRVPLMNQTTIAGISAYWLRCRLTDEQTGVEGTYKSPPQLEGVQVLASGRTGQVRHAVNISNELLGRSDGTRDQRFRLRYAPLLARNKKTDYLEVIAPSGERQKWEEVRDFGNSQPDDQHYTIDSRSGELSFGPVLPQPNGGVYRFGTVPSLGSVLEFSHYQYGGGVEGNVAVGTLTVLKTALPAISRVFNRQEGREGLDGQSIDDARLRAPQFLRTRTRAVTADDFEQLAREVSPLVGRTHCISPGTQPSEIGPQPGMVVLLVLPAVAEPSRLLTDELLNPSPSLLRLVRDDLNKRLVLGSTLEVRAPDYVRVIVRALLRTASGSGEGLRNALQEQAETKLYRYLNPYIGGLSGQGWPFGSSLYRSDVIGWLQQLANVEQVIEVELFTSDSSESKAEIVLHPYQVICAGLPMIQVI